MLVLLAACRGYFPEPPFEECQPYDLECPDCTLAEDLAEPGALRVWRCEDADGRSFDAVTRLPDDGSEALDTHFYATEDGLRVAAWRSHDAPVPVCGRELRDEWWGEILACEPSCELEPDLSDADPALPACDAA